MIEVSRITVDAENRRPLDAAHVAELAKSIAEIGLLNPILLDAKDSLVGGHHRLAAVRSLGWKQVPVTYQVVRNDGLDHLRRRLAELDENLTKPLSALELGEALAEKKQIHLQLHPETRNGGDKKSVSAKNQLAESANRSERFSKETARAIGKSETVVKEAIKVATDLPKATRDALRETPIANRQSDLVSLARMEPARRDAVVEHIKAGAPTVRDALRLNTVERIGQAAKLPETKYRVVYADPPWSYGGSMHPDTGGAAEDHYPTMKLAEICALPVVEMVEDDAVLFLWTTSPLLEESFQVVRAWGFQYKASFVWDKIKSNLGHYNSVRHEFLLVCTRGKGLPDVYRQFDSVVSEVRAEHSRKPETFREIIDTLYTVGKRVELFRRGGKVGAWDAWGNEHA